MIGSRFFEWRQRHESSNATLTWATNKASYQARQQQAKEHIKRGTKEATAGNSYNPQATNSKSPPKPKTIDG
jgi:hypothetical protein